MSWKHEVLQNVLEHEVHFCDSSCPALRMFWDCPGMASVVLEKRICENVL